MAVARDCSGSPVLGKPQKHLKGLLRHSCLDPIPRDSDSAGLGQGPLVCISSKFPGMLLLPVHGPHLEEPCLTATFCPSAWRELNTPKAFIVWLPSVCATRRHLPGGMRDMAIEFMLCWPSHVLCQGVGLVCPERAPFTHHPPKGSAFSYSAQKHIWAVVTLKKKKSPSPTVCEQNIKCIPTPRPLRGSQSHKQCWLLGVGDGPNNSNLSLCPIMFSHHRRDKSSPWAVTVYGPVTSCMKSDHYAGSCCHRENVPELIPSCPPAASRNTFCVPGTVVDTCRQMLSRSSPAQLVQRAGAPFFAKSSIGGPQQADHLGGQSPLSNAATGATSAS